MTRNVLLPWSLLALLVACGDPDSPPTGPAPESTIPPDPRDATEGRAVFERVCSECHAGSRDDAPVIGRPDTWADRSPLWQAVLYEHAETGYLDMPPRGGHPELTDQEVASAAEYMLNQTFPEPARDRP